ncbi:hypothetical protein EYF80_006303 [Liparis tanakae]|uniref:Uncharacterized protein n=1 Tax=Liparis tanakae TaxID=230148 RepID=A0A4Z2J1C1_9TELE|nr:hypothetical protein EYF80_006303 [Liparis tanakae]
MWSHAEAYLSLHVGLLNSVADNLSVAVVLGQLPLQRRVAAPHLHHPHGDGRTGLLWRVGERRRRMRVGGFCSAARRDH